MARAAPEDRSSDRLAVNGPRSFTRTDTVSPVFQARAKRQTDGLLSLAQITRDAPHILILDEPTNHLDVEAREALVEALAGLAGAVVAVSHDRHLLGLIADRLILVDGGTAKDFAGSLDDYRDMVLRSGNGGAEEGGEGSTKRASRKGKRCIAAEGRESSKALRKKVAQAEAELKWLWHRCAELDEMLARPQWRLGE